MSWNTLRQALTAATVVALLVHATANGQESASDIPVPAKITNVLAAHSSLLRTTSYRKREQQLFELWWQLKLNELQFDSIRQTQAKFLRLLRKYVETTGRFQRLTEAESNYANSECRLWNRKDPQILPYARQLLRDGLEQAIEDAFNARLDLEALSSREFVDEVDECFGRTLPWERITVQAFSRRDTHGVTKAVLPSSIVQQLRESPNISEYTYRAKRKFWTSTYALEILPVLLIEIARSGKVQHVHLIKSTGNAANDEQAIKIASDLSLVALPKSYRATCWYVLLSDLNKKPWPPMSPVIPVVPRRLDRSHPASQSGADTKLGAALQHLLNKKQTQ